MLEKKRLTAAQCMGLLSKNFKLYCDDALEPYGLTNGLYLYLIFVKHHPSCSLVDVRDGMQVDKALVTRMVNKLCELGYVRKDKRADDARSYCLNLTEEGQEVYAFAKKLPTDWEEKLLGWLTTEEQEEFRRMLLKICEGML